MKTALETQEPNANTVEMFWCSQGRSVFSVLFILMYIRKAYICAVQAGTCGHEHNDAHAHYSTTPYTCPACRAISRPELAAARHAHMAVHDRLFDSRIYYIHTYIYIYVRTYTHITRTQHEMCVL